MDSELQWQEDLEFVRWYVNQYLNSEDVRELIPGELEFHINDLHSINAKACLTTEQNYRIEFNAGLIKALAKEARSIVERSPLIFRGVDRSNEDLVGRCHIWLMVLWIDFIFHHEMAHVYCGHLELVPGEPKWYELKSHEEAGALPLTPYQQQRVEAHANRHAATNLLRHFARYYSEASRYIRKARSGAVLE